MKLTRLVPVLVLFAACSPPTAQTDEASDGLFRRSWSNWAGNVRCRPQRIARPTTEAALRAAVKSASNVRIAGGGHSWSALACADELMIDTRSLTRVLAIDTTARRIKVEAGIRLRELDEVVALHGLALATEPTIDEITAGGAISTASHGTGLAHGAFSEEVVALDVVDANGTLVTIDDPDRLRAARVGLGALGVIYAITFRLVPAFNLAIDERVVDEADAFDNLEVLLAEHEHVDLFWFLTEEKVFLRTYDRTSAPRKVSHPTLNWVEEWIVRTWVAHFGLAVASFIPGLTPLLNFAEPFLFRTQSDIDRSDKIFHRFPGHQTVYSMEYVIPIDRTRDALQAIRDSLDATGFYPNIPPYLRFVGAAGDGDLSPMRGRDSLAIEVLSYVGFTGWEPFFRDLEPRFLALGGRPHWGKLFYTNPRPLYDAATWTHVDKIRTQLDPNRKFSNPLIRSVFGP